MDKISVRLPPEAGRKLVAEARKFSETTGESVTVSDLIRACIGEKFPQVTARIRSEKMALVELQEQVTRLNDRAANLERGLENLVQTLTEVFPVLSTREQVDSLTDAIAAVFNAMKER